MDDELPVTSNKGPCLARFKPSVVPSERAGPLGVLALAASCAFREESAVVVSPDDPEPFTCFSGIPARCPSPTFDVPAPSEKESTLFGIGLDQLYAWGFSPALSGTDVPGWGLDKPGRNSPVGNP